MGKTGIIICELFVNYNRTFCIKPLQKAVFEKNVKENNKIRTSTLDSIMRRVKTSATEIQKILKR